MLLPPVQKLVATLFRANSRARMKPSLAGGAKHRDFTVNHGVFITIGPIIKLSECFHLAAQALMDCQMDSNTF